MTGLRHVYFVLSQLLRKGLRVSAAKGPRLPRSTTHVNHTTEFLILGKSQMPHGYRNKQLREKKYLSHWFQN
jgi:hypothetical protein